jgi:redox-sensitive bicupin YhaK (pirin superfamily)
MKKVRHIKKAPYSKQFGLAVKQVVPSAISDVDPFVFLDHAGPFEGTLLGNGISPHPHAGIATISYLIEGSMMHVDSLGNRVKVDSGDLLWMSAGKGIIHDEGSSKESNTKYDHGMQFWISLPADKKFSDPFIQFYPSKDLPVNQENGVFFKVICGDYKNMKSPVKSMSPAYIYEVKLEEGANLSLNIDKGLTSAVYIVLGNSEVNDQLVSSGEIAKLELLGSEINLKAKSQVHLFVFGGKPLDEEIVAHGPFVMNTWEQIEQVNNDYMLGKMGIIPNFTKESVEGKPE